MKVAPKAGDIIHYDFTSDSKGREIRYRRPALVVSSQKFNKLGYAWVCPISSGRAEIVRNAGLLVPLMGACLETDGSVQVNQLRSIDLRARMAKVDDRVIKESLVAVLEEVRGKILLILGIEF